MLNEAWPWAIWYPLRRSGSFERLEPSARGSMLREHGEIGKAYGEAAWRTMSDSLATGWIVPTASF